ncbi:WD40 repeat-like protein [Pisolithus albus]|nr:WD40 repeat-like protein [Pisolithus albus]
MAHSDSEGETIDDLEFETRTTDADGDEDNEIDEDLLGAIENGVEDASEAEEESPTDDSDDEDEEDEDEEAIVLPLDTDPVPQPLVRPQSPSPAEARKRGLLFFPSQAPRSFTVEAVCAIPHPVPTHYDGYIRDYDIFTSVNGKVTLTAPQRHHCNVVEGNMKAGQIRCWWENPDYFGPQTGYQASGESLLSPVYSLAMHSDALWALGGSQRGHINLFTVRHDPGRLIHKGLFSASWDGEAMQWDLNTGQVVRKFTAHGAQLVAIAVRPLNPLTQCFSSTFSAGTAGEWDAYPPSSGLRHEIRHERAPSMFSNQNLISNQPTQETDTKSDTSFDPLFDDEPDADGEVDSTSPMDGGGANQAVDSKKENTSVSGHASLAVPDATFALPNQQSQQVSRPSQSSAVAPPKNAPPLLNPESSAAFSPDVLMIAAIDGQVMLWDKRVNTPGRGVGRLWMSEKTPPWCVSACWSTDGAQVYAGRRNGTVDVWDVRLLGCSRPCGTPRLLRSLRNPPSSGVVSCVVPFPDGRHIACASVDNIRLWNAAEAGETDGNVKARGGVPFKIIPGHHGGYVSQMLVDPGARFLVSASSNRGWHGDSTRTVFVHDIKPVL